MRILYITQYYREPAQAGGLRHYGHTRRWAQAGHDVTVITASESRMPASAAVEIDLGEGHAAGRCLVRRLRVPPHGDRFVRRLVNYIAFMVGSFRAGLRLRGPFDVLVASSPSLFVAVAGTLLGRLRGIPVVLEVRDLWPESAVATGFLRNPLLIFLARRLERWLYRRARRVVALTEGIRSGIRSAGVPSERIHVVPNAVDDDLLAFEETLDCRALVGHRTGEAIAMYAGAHGINNALDFVIDAAAEPECAAIRFLLIGQGTQTARLKQRVKSLGLSNVEFLGYQPRERVPRLLHCADVLLWPVLWSSEKPALRVLKEGAVPNKLYDYLAAGKPIVTSVPRSGEAVGLLDAYGCAVYTDPSGKEIARGVQESLSSSRDAELGLREDFIAAHGRSKRAAEMLELLEAGVGDT